MYDDEIRDWVERAYEHLDPKNSKLDLPEDTEVILDYDELGYYLTSLSSECVLWLEDVDSIMVTGGLRQVLSEEHLGVHHHPHPESVPN